MAVAPRVPALPPLRDQQAMVARSRAVMRPLALKAEQIASHTFELSQLLIDVLGITNAGGQLGSLLEHVTYHSPATVCVCSRLGTRQQDLVRTS